MRSLAWSILTRRNNSRTKALRAECKIQEFGRASLALNAIDGRKWWGTTIRAFLFTADRKPILPVKPTQDVEPRDLHEVYKISPGNVDGKNPRHDGKRKHPTRGHQKIPWPTKRSYPAPYWGQVDEGYLWKGLISTFTCPPLYGIPDQRSHPQPYPEWAEPWKPEVGECGRKLRKAVDGDWYMHYLDTDSDTTLVDNEETPAKKYDGPIIIDGQIEE
ncbi:MAG: hypothetical protein Q9223_006281 [Gallowayella weberi]